MDEEETEEEMVVNKGPFPDKPAPLGLPTIPPSNTQFLERCKLEGYTKEPKIKVLSESTKLLRAALFSFGMMALTVWAVFFSKSFEANQWIGTWESIMNEMRTTAIMFSQVVLAKMKKYYSQKEPIE